MPSPTAIPNGIYWRAAGVSHGDSGATQISLVQLHQAVNRLPETTASVTVAGSDGVTFQVPCTGTTIIDGQSYAVYQRTGGFAYTVGVTYQLTSITSIGTAAASLEAPGGITHNAEYTQSSWTAEGNGDFVMVTDPSYDITFNTTGLDAVSPVNIPSSAYPSPGQYRLTTTVSNVTLAVAGAAAGSGFVTLDMKTSTFTK
jgi:hypothetical protein